MGTASRKIMILVINIYSFWTVRRLMFLKESLLLTKPAFIWSKAQQNVKCDFFILLFKITNAIYSCDFKVDFFSIINPVTWSFRNHSNIRICCQKKTYDYYYVENSWGDFFQIYLMNRKFIITTFIWNRNVFTITFDQFRAFLLNKSTTI